MPTIGSLMPTLTKQVREQEETNKLLRELISLLKPTEVTETDSNVTKIDNNS